MYYIIRPCRNLKTALTFSHLSESLLNETGTVEYGYVSLSSNEGMEKIYRASAYDERAKNFVKQHYGPETASQYDQEKSNLLESLLADYYRDTAETKSNTNNT